MGGNALKNFGVKRVDAATYDRIKAFALEKLQEACVRMAVPYEMRDKKDYGDVDILCIVKPEFQANWKQWLQDTFNPRAILHNSNVWSFNIEDLQIDAITTTEDNFSQYHCFLCYGDLSMCLGRISRLYDLKYGIYGLEMPIRDPETNHVTDTLLVSNEPRKILPFLGYDYARWEAGFKTHEELRDFLFSSPRIHQGFLTATSESGKHARRDRQRDGFSRFYAYFEEHVNEFPLKADLPIPHNVEERLAYIESVFPESQLRAKYELTQKRITDFAAARNKFSGKQLQALFPELEGRAFGAYMELWTQQWTTREEQVNYVLTHSIEQLTEKATRLRGQLKS
jgi:hypothetical protein